MGLNYVNPQSSCITIQLKGKIEKITSVVGGLGAQAKPFRKSLDMKHTTLAAKQKLKPRKHTEKHKNRIDSCQFLKNGRQHGQANF